MFDKTKKIIACAAAVLLFSLHVYSQVLNKDMPAKGEWDFQMSKIWEIEETGGNIFANIGTILSDDNETVYVSDRKSFKVYIIDKNGTFISAFGKRGEGPGELKQMERFFLVDGQLAFPDRNAGRVLYFSTKGEFVNSVLMPTNLSPRAMIDKNNLFSVPYINWRDPKGKAQGFIYNLEDKSKKVIFEFSTYQKGVVRKTSGKSRSSYSYSNSDITPVMVTACDRNKIYYGMSNVYSITVKDLKEDSTLVFSLERKKKRVPPGFKDEVLQGIDFPGNIKDEIKKGFPDFLTYFNTIFSDSEQNIYVVVTDPVHQNERKLDIFSPAGVYMYRSEISVEEGMEIAGSHINKDKLYLALETEDGDIKLAKYTIHPVGRIPF